MQLIRVATLEIAEAAFGYVAEVALYVHHFMIAVQCVDRPTNGRGFLPQGVEQIQNLGFIVAPIQLVSCLHHDEPAPTPFARRIDRTAELKRRPRRDDIPMEITNRYDPSGAGNAKRGVIDRRRITGEGFCSTAEAACFRSAGQLCFAAPKRETEHQDQMLERASHRSFVSREGRADHPTLAGSRVTLPLLRREARLPLPASGSRS